MSRTMEPRPRRNVRHKWQKVDANTYKCVCGCVRKSWSQEYSYEPGGRTPPECTRSF